jgi:glycosyltransferase involved in cell wall biosynthesis
MRLLFVTGSLCHGGAERHTITVMNCLAERRHDCHALYIKSQADQLSRIHLADDATVGSLNASRYLDGSALARFADHLNHIEPSAIVAANPYALMYASLAMRIARRPVPLMVTFHSSRLLGYKEQLQMLAYRPLFWRADCAIFVCETQKRYWMRRAVLSRANEVIYNGVDTDEFAANGGFAEKQRVRQECGFDDADYVIGIAAVLRPEKNHIQLVDAIALLRARGVRARALIIGDGPMRAAIEARAREHHLHDSIVISGYQQQVIPYVAACDVMVLCSLTETFSLAAVEAMALSKPVIHSDVGGAAEMIIPGHNGFLFKVGDTSELVGKLALLADGAISMRMGMNARQRAEALFSEKTMINRYETTLLRLCANKLRARAAVAG